MVTLGLQQPGGTYFRDSEAPYENKTSSRLPFVIMSYFSLGLYFSQILPFVTSSSYAIHLKLKLNDSAFQTSLKRKMHARTLSSFLVVSREVECISLPRNPSWADLFLLLWIQIDTISPIVSSYLIPYFVETQSGFDRALLEEGQGRGVQKGDQLAHPEHLYRCRRDNLTHALFTADCLTFSMITL